MTTSAAAVVSFPLERPPLRSRKRDPQPHSALPYFIAGEENRMVSFVATSDVMLLDFGNPILLVGPAGTGKSAIALHLAARQSHGDFLGADKSDSSRPVNYYTAVDFARQYAEAISADDLPPLRQELNDTPILIIDDLHHIADKGSAQIELALRIEGRTARGLTTIVTCRRLPSEIRGMKPPLVSRTLPGLTIPLTTPTGAARSQILAELAVHLRLEISEEFLQQLDAELDPRLPVRSLEAAIKQVSLWCRMNDSPMTAEAIRSAIEVVGKAEEVPLSAIAMAVAKYFRLRLADLKSSSRKQNLVRARSLGILLSRRLTSKSMHQIGDFYGGRDHTTVLHAIRKTESQLANDPDLIRAAEEIQEKLGSF